LKKTALMTLLLAAAGSAFGSGFDQAVLERFNYPGPSIGGLSFEPSLLCQPGYGAIFLHTDPYRVEALSWDFAAARYGWRSLGFYASFRSYRLERLYNDVTIKAGVASHIYKGIYSSVSVARRREDFKGNDDFARLTCDFRVSYDGGIFIAQAGLEEMAIKDPYVAPAGGRSEPAIRATYYATEDIGLSAGYRRDQFNRGRWAFAQDVALAKGFRLRIAYTNNPGTLEWGLDLSYKTLTFLIDYMAANKLSDTVILGLSLGN
jgi:hypothetical protein